MFGSLPHSRLPKNVRHRRGGSPQHFSPKVWRANRSPQLRRRATRALAGTLGAQIRNGAKKIQQIASYLWQVWSLFSPLSSIHCWGASLGHGRRRRRLASPLKGAGSYCRPRLRRRGVAHRAEPRTSELPRTRRLKGLACVLLIPSPPHGLA